MKRLGLFAIAFVAGGGIGCDDTARAVEQQALGAHERFRVQAPEAEAEAHAELKDVSNEVRRKSTAVLTAHQRNIDRRLAELDIHWTQDRAENATEEALE